MSARHGTHFLHLFYTECASENRNFCYYVECFDAVPLRTVFQHRYGEQRNLRNLIFRAAILLSALACAAEHFQITSVEYDTTGATTEYALSHLVEIDSSRVFQTEEELAEYIADIQSQFTNERNFQAADVAFSIAEAENGIRAVSLTITTVDSHHFIVVPYPKYDSSSGVSFKIKARDSNFFGTLSEMNADFFISAESEDEDNPSTDYKIGFNFDYDHPFALGPLRAKWLNEYGLAYTFGKSYPEFNARTGLSLELPFERFSVVLDATQGAFINFDYSDFGDEFYGQTEATLGVPAEIADAGKWGKIIGRPFVQFVAHYDADGIDPENIDLSSPILSGGISVAAQRINWNGNFRSGYSAEARAQHGWNFQNSVSVPKIAADVKAFASFGRFGLAGRFFGIWQQNMQVKIGELLRGVNDFQKYAVPPLTQKALKVESAVLLSLDVPFRLFFWDWSVFTKNETLRKLNFEVQLAPFVDMALTSNPATGRNFSPKDGFYTGGLEILVYPERWRSLVVRASLGFDLSRTILSDVVETSFRKPSGLVKPYEIYIGIGLNY